MKTTRYFEEQVLRKRPYIRRDWCEAALARPLRREVQPDGRVRLWWKVEDLSDERDRHMRLHYYPETDSLYIDLNGKPGAEARQIVEGVVADFDTAGNVIGLDIEQASAKLDLSKIETIAPPPAKALA